MDSSLLASVSSVLGCKVDVLPLKCLGLPLTNKNISSINWTPLINKIQQRLALWQGPLLSSIGRLTLIKAIISSIQVYYLSMFAMPKVI